MGIAVELCACSEQAIIPNSKLCVNVENEDINLYNSNNNNIKNDNNEKAENKENNDNNNIDQIKKMNKICNVTKINNEQSNDAETYNNIISNGGAILTPKNKKETNISQKNKKKEKEKNRKENDKTNNKVKELKEEIDENIEISDTVLSELIIPEKIKTISKDKKKKIKGRNDINVVLIGYNEVGKSSFCIWLVEHKFEDFYIPSICDENFCKKQVYNDHNYKINYSVILGGTKIQKNENTLNNADFFLLLYDITKIRSFNQINIYLRQLRKLLFFYDKERKNPNFCIIGNKYDLEGERKVAVEFINKCIEKNNINHFDISVKTGYNINIITQSIIQIFDKIAFSNK